MTGEEITLEDLRREIDRIDDSLHDLLMLRAELVEQVRILKSDDGGEFYRPAREAEIVRRLVARHRGAFPKSVLVRIWREIMSALVRMQGPFAVAVWEPENEPGYRDLARDHFGGDTPLTGHQGPRGVIHAVAQGEVTVGVLPLPQSGDVDPWWPVLGGQAEGRLSIVGRLPFGALANGRSALVVGRSQQARTGADHSYILIETTGAISGNSVSQKLSETGLMPEFITSWSGREASPEPMFLVEIPDFVAEDDGRVVALRDALGEAVRAISVIGGFALPLRAIDLRPAAPESGTGGAGEAGAGGP
jgi:chorismate mutase-like protein